MFLDLVMRAVIQGTALDFRQMQYAALVGTDDLITAGQAAILTGLRELSPIFGGRETGATAFRLIAHATIRILTETRNRNADVWRRGIRTYSVHTLYNTLLQRFLQAAYDERRKKVCTLVLFCRWGIVS